MYSRWFGPLLAVPVVLFAACDEHLVEPTSRPQFTSTATAASGLPQPISNSIKYRDAGKKPSTGRSGAASLTARALIDKNGEVDLAITTGSEENLDTRSGPGNVDKIQIKTFGPNGVHLTTTNHNRLKNGGFALYSLSHLTQRGAVQVQANVSGIDPTRNDVVTVTEVIKLRPDLAAQSLSAPDQAIVNTPVNISAIVHELNGDVGARASCVLSVDGSEVDRASGIWVDAGGTVSCAFTHRFEQVGARALSVAVTQVTPGTGIAPTTKSAAPLRLCGQTILLISAGWKMSPLQPWTSRTTNTSRRPHSRSTHSVTQAVVAQITPICIAVCRTNYRFPCPLRFGT